MIYATNDADWQEKVCARSDGRCIWPGCGSKWNAAGHHVFDRRFKELRLVLENGICLCGLHHQKIGTAPEQLREKLSKLLMGPKIYLELKDLLHSKPDNIEAAGKNSLPSSRDTGILW
jgi:hypothetical protein